MPPWIQAENISWLEQSELNMLKCFTYVPVVITFSVFLFIFVYYVAVSEEILIQSSVGVESSSFPLSDENLAVRHTLISPDSVP